MQIRMREDEKRMMEDDVIPIPDLMMGEEDLRGKGGECGIKDGLSFPMHVYCLIRTACTYVWTVWFVSAHRWCCVWQHDRRS